MYKTSEFTKISYKTGEVADILGVSTKTIQNYDKFKKLTVCRTEGNRRCIMLDDLLRFLDDKGLLLDDTLFGKRDVIYARVSSHDQKSHGVHIIVVKDEQANKSVQEELVEDMMSLIASFSGKLYGMRSKSNKERRNTN